MTGVAITLADVTDLITEISTQPDIVTNDVTTYLDISTDIGTHPVTDVTGGTAAVTDIYTPTDYQQTGSPPVFTDTPATKFQTDFQTDPISDIITKQQTDNTGFTDGVTIQNTIGTEIDTVLTTEFAGTTYPDIVTDSTLMATSNLVSEGMTEITQRSQPTDYVTDMNTNTNTNINTNTIIDTSTNSNILTDSITEEPTEITSLPAMSSAKTDRVTPSIAVPGTTSSIGGSTNQGENKVLSLNNIHVDSFYGKATERVVAIGYPRTDQCVSSILASQWHPYSRSSEKVTDINFLTFLFIVISGAPR